MMNNMNNEVERISLEEFVSQAWAETSRYACQTAFTCPENARGNVVASLTRYPSADACATALAQVSPFSTLTFADGPHAIDVVRARDSVTAGRLSYDGAQAEACVAELQALVTQSICSRALVYSDAPACSTVFTGLAMRNQECLTGADCAAGTCADASFIDPTRCLGLCDEQEQPSCFGTDCADGEYCDSMRRQCAPARQVAETCTDVILCDTGLECARGRCAAPSSVNQGAPCDDSTQCVFGLRCDTDDTFTCVRRENTAGATGAPCTTATLAGTGDAICGPGLVCKVTETQTLEGVCTAPVAAGQPCTGVAIECDGVLCPNECAPGLYCEGADAAGAAGTCAATKPDGQPCSSDAACSSTSCINGLCGRTEAQALCPFADPS